MSDILVNAATVFRIMTVKKKRPIAIRVRERALERMSKGESIRAVAEYICTVCLQFPGARTRILDLVEKENPLLFLEAKRHLDRRLADARIKKARRRKQMEEMEDSAESCYQAHVESLKSQYQSLHGDDERIRWGVSLSPADRKLVFNSREIKDIVSLRKSALSTSKVCAVLNCTLTELNRWDTPGLLPHAFKKRISIGPKMVDARFWLERDVDGAKVHIDSWRDSHALKKRWSRLKKPLKIIC